MTTLDDREHQHDNSQGSGSYCRHRGCSLPSFAVYCPGCGTRIEALPPEPAKSGTGWKDESKSGRDWKDESKSGRDWIDSGGGDVFLVDNMTSDSSRVPTRQWRWKQRKLPVSEPPVWTAAIGLVGSLASMAALVQDAVPYGIGAVAALLFLTLFVWWAVFAQLRKQRFVSLGFIKNLSAKHALESDGQGGIYFTKIGAECPFCPSSSHMDLVNDEHRQLWLVCRRNPRLHRLAFDHTQLPMIDSPD